MSLSTAAFRVHSHTHTYMYIHTEVYISPCLDLFHAGNDTVPEDRRLMVKPAIGCGSKVNYNENIST